MQGTQWTDKKWHIRCNRMVHNAWFAESKTNQRLHNGCLHTGSLKCRKISRTNRPLQEKQLKMQRSKQFPGRNSPLLNVFFISQRTYSIFHLSSPLFCYLACSHSLSATCTVETHAHTDGIENTPFWWINLYILEPLPVLVSILWRPLPLLSWVCLQPSGVISLLAVLNSLIICVLHKKRTIPQRHTTACSACWGLALMCLGCCVLSAS